MAPKPSKLRHLRADISRGVHGWSKIAWGFLSSEHPLLAHIIPMRRCNLACKYCNEFDDFSKPVPRDVMFRRVDKLGEFGTSVITISGGEPLLHPDLDQIIGRIRENGAVAGMITNGYLLVPDRIERLNRAGLEWLQISIDNVNPDDVSKNFNTAASSHEGEFVTSTTAEAPFSASARPSPVRLLTPVWGAAATASWPRSRSLLTSFDPMSPVPPTTTIFMIVLPFYGRISNRPVSLARTGQPTRSRQRLFVACDGTQPVHS